MDLPELPLETVKRAHALDQLLEPQRLLPGQSQQPQRRVRCASKKVLKRELDRLRHQGR